ncbi:winged helix-turn-helix domain-containing protein [Halomarina halobia]|uniref:Winged helix-turn-helix domain-containing protein n=1 Tax=Halomarina halobia TaxID=3033386 RepID=A0ABD6A9A2_9EURY|nr:winged helix-turn-helix transcriptional regulator [Halomarina sp. PSR21]
MSDSPHASGTGNAPLPSPMPRAVIHKRILDAARSRPDASMEELAADVSGASTKLVEQVLEEYGDPAKGEHEIGGAGSDPSEEHDPPVGAQDAATNERDARSADTPESDPARLTAKQRQALRAIHENPEATQRELGEVLDVSRTTVNQRVNSIDGFEWTNRREFVETMFDTDTMKPKEPDQTPRSVQDLTDRVDDLAERVEALDARIEKRSAQPGSAFSDPALVHKIAHACMRSEHVTEEEELRIFEEFFARVGPRE